MKAQEYLTLLEQHTGPLPREFALRFLALAKQHGGQQLLVELGKFRNKGWHWLDFLEEAETHWPVPISEPKERIFADIIRQIKELNQNETR